MSTIILCVICVVLLMVGLLTRLRGQKFKAYIMPNVPHPKTTLVHMQKFNKGLLLSFTPETFNDIHINRLDEGSSSSSSSSSSSGGIKDKASAPAPDSMLDHRGQREGRAPGSGSGPRSPSSHSQLSCQLLLWQPPLGLGTQDGSLGDSESTTLQDDEEFWDDEPEDHGDGDDDGEEEDEDIMEDLSSAEERLLGGTDGDSGTAADSGDSQPSSIGMRSAVQEGRKDEAYVTMSSLFKTQ
ncbi:interleukin-7 receptor subunit alpha [Engraulis encrasicolus]|uniref:interleukin-7 receptor subunit alpha n=1 Tax=Engraulis encrasicolus TaxID=184585 RepID=UPI002FD6CAB1